MHACRPQLAVWPLCVPVGVLPLGDRRSGPLPHMNTDKPSQKCTPTRSALLTGRYAIRSGNHTVMLPGVEGAGLVPGNARWVTYSPRQATRRCAWASGMSARVRAAGPPTMGLTSGMEFHTRMTNACGLTTRGIGPAAIQAPVLEGRKGEKLRETEQLTYDVRRSIDVEFNRRATRFVQQSSQAATPFFVYFNHSMLHFPVVPRDEYKGKSGNGDWADSLLELDGDFGELLDLIDRLGLRDNTIVVFAGDNGNEEYLLHRGTAGFWEGSLLHRHDGSLRTPCLVRWPGHVAAGRQSNEIMHVTDWFTTLLTMVGIPVPADREMDGIDQSAFLAGAQEDSNRDAFIYWNGPQVYGVKCQHFKFPMIEQKYMFDPALELPTPRIINLLTDPKEREPYNAVYGLAEVLRGSS